MPELIHAWALAPAAVGTCCVAADRGRVRTPELVASLLMLVAMIDVTLVGAVAPVYWAGMLIVGAMVLAAMRGARRRPVRPASGASRRHPTGMTLHTTLGMVTMAMLALGAGHSATQATASHAHGAGGALLLSAWIGATCGYAVFSAVLARRVGTRLDRAQISSMGASVLLMAAAMLA